MATQTVEFRSPPSQTVTAKLFAVGSDTQVASVSTTEATNRKGTYSAAYTDVAAGEYELIALVGAVPVARWFVTLTLSTAKFQTYDKVGAVELDSTTAAQITAIEADAAASVGYLTTLVSRITSGAAQMFLDLIAMITGSGTADAKFDTVALSNAPSGTGGDATLAKQTEILAAVAGVTSSVSAHAARLALEVQIQGFPAVICRNSDYVTETESEIRLTLLDLTGTAITEIAGTPVAILAWLFGMGTETTPAIIAGAVTWDAGTSELVIQFARSVTTGKPLGSVTWQIGVSTGSGATLKNRWLGGGTTRLIERQF